VMRTTTGSENVVPSGSSRYEAAGGLPPIVAGLSDGASAVMVSELTSTPPVNADAGTSNAAAPSGEVTVSCGALKTRAMVNSASLSPSSEISADVGVTVDGAAEG